MKKYQLENGRLLYIHDSYLFSEDYDKFHQYLNNLYQLTDDKDIIIIYDPLDCKEFSSSDLNSLYQEIKELIIEKENDEFKFDENNFLSIINERFIIITIRNKFFNPSCYHIRGFRTLSYIILSELAMYYTSIEEVMTEISFRNSKNKYNKLEYEDNVFMIYNKNDIDEYYKIIDDIVTNNNIKLPKYDKSNYVYFISSTTNISEIEKEIGIRILDKNDFSIYNTFNIILDRDIKESVIEEIKRFCCTSFNSERMNIFYSFKDFFMYYYGSKVKL